VRRGRSREAEDVEQLGAGSRAEGVWLLYDIIRTDPERMMDVERSMRDAPG
jgi:hypothetical protein